MFKQLCVCILKSFYVHFLNVYYFQFCAHQYEESEIQTMAVLCTIWKKATKNGYIRRA